MNQTTLPGIEDKIHVHLSSAGKLNRLEAAQWLPCTQLEMFEFFSDAFQLENLTPSWLHFEVLTPRPIIINAGTLIDYKLCIKGVPLRWQSRIAVWEPPYRFVDEQIRGPYRFWRHEHLLEPVAEGTLCKDIVDFKAPCDRLASLLVRADLIKIFGFRQRRLRELFAGTQSAAESS